VGGVGSIDIEAGIGGQLLEPPGNLVLFDCWKNVLIIEPQTSQNEQGEGAVLGLYAAAHRKQQLFFVPIFPSIPDKLTLCGGSAGK